MIDWDATVKTEGQVVWGRAWRILGSAADADECFQEAFVDALRFSQRNRIENIRAILIRCVTVRSIDRLRQRRRRKNKEEMPQWDALRNSDPSPPQDAQAAELSQRLREALGKIPSKQAQIFCLAALDDWSYQQIAEHLKISAGSVGVLMHRARKNLQKLLGSLNEVSK
jgi:RNA polymerase sigma factor (sigma-70 family)